jgi:NAD(P) transhydrogenase subunit alpha
MRVGIPNERTAEERRVALVPESVARLTAAGHEVSLEHGAGLGAAIPDAAYVEAGATVAAGRDAMLGAADVVVMIGHPRPADLESLRPGVIVVGTLQPLRHPELVEALAERGVTAISMDAIPRVTRAQRMDSLSSQSTVAGYKAVLAAANLLPKFFPMLMTAAGTVPPARVLVVGAGVAGLQAIATARRLGAVVSAFDTRPVVKEQVESLGASFLELDLEGGEDERGYATALSEEAHRAELELIERHVRESDVVVTTALIPGRPPPRLISAEAVAAMRPGSVIVDLAADAGGNCELTEPGGTVIRHGVAIVGLRNMAATLPTHASQMYSRNVTALLELLAGEEGEARIDRDDEIFADACVTHEGAVVSRLLRASA